LSGAQADDAWKVRQRQVHRVQARHQRGVAALCLLVEQAKRVIGQHRIHGRNRFVGQDQFRLLVEHPGDADALQLAAGELVAAHVELVRQVQSGKRFGRAAAVQRVDQAEQAFG